MVVVFACYNQAMKNASTTAPLKISETQKMAQNLVKNLSLISEAESKQHATVIGLFGDLGSGKTTFMQFFGEALGIHEKILSPTFVIEKIYKISGPDSGSEIVPEISSHFDHLVHIDACRLDDPNEIIVLGWTEILKNPRNLIAVEWADKIAELLPEDHIHIEFKHHDDESRVISVVSKN